MRYEYNGGLRLRCRGHLEITVNWPLRPHFVHLLLATSSRVVLSAWWSLLNRRSRSQELLANELELELIQTQMAQKQLLRAEVGMRVRCANKASAE